MLGVKFSDDLELVCPPLFPWTWPTRR
jgi:hypothetical protein